MNNILLDTHTLIWYANGEECLLRSARKIISEAANNRQLFLSAISVWELAMLEKKHRITLEMPVHEWINQAIEQIHIKIVELTPKILIESCHLPQFHDDPADRMIVASARIERFSILTRDKRILDYGHKKFVSVIKA